MLLQPRVHFVTSTECLLTRPMWAGCHLRDVDVRPVKLPRATTPNASQVRNLPLPVEVGGLRETALSITAAQIPQPQEDVSPRPLQIPMRESEHHLPDLPRIGPQCCWRIMFGRWGFTRQPESSKCAHLRVPTWPDSDLEDEQFRKMLASPLYTNGNERKMKDKHELITLNVYIHSPVARTFFCAQRTHCVLRTCGVKCEVEQVPCPFR